MSRILLKNSSLIQRTNSAAVASNKLQIVKATATTATPTTTKRTRTCSVTSTDVVNNTVNIKVPSRIQYWKSLVSVNSNKKISNNNNNNNEYKPVKTSSSPNLFRRSQLKTLNALGSGGVLLPSVSFSTFSNQTLKPTAATTANHQQSTINKTLQNSRRTLFTTNNTKMSKILNMDSINPNFIAMEYAVRGPLVIRAGEIENELKKGVKKPFDQVIRANIGDCHAMGQKPLTFVRQLLALTMEPSLIDTANYPEDVKQRARDLLKGCSGGSVGSYTESAGLEIVRRQVADFIQRRDNFPSDWHNIYITSGATPGIKSILALLRCKHNGKRAGIMVPTPQYPLYSATIAEFGMEKVAYYLEEETNWSLSIDELTRSLNEAKAHCNPRALVVINPGNPTGQVLQRENICKIIQFAHENQLLLLADEVYQDNIYAKDSKFYSFKQVMQEMGAPYKDMEMTSFMSTSKGYLGECGIRGGYMEILNFDPQVMATLAKSITASLCSTTAGQITVSAYVNSPRPGEPSYDNFIKEKTAVLKSLKERADLVYDTISRFEGFKINVIQGAMYAFPQIEIPAKAIEAAKAKNMPADTFYAFELLESTGVCIIPGSGFGQKPGTYHFRTTILPETSKLKLMMSKFRDFNIEFMKKYK